MAPNAIQISLLSLGTSSRAFLPFNECPSNTEAWQQRRLSTLALDVEQEPITSQ
jgi:hypothetical protein